MGTLTSSGACLIKAGKNVSSDFSASGASNAKWETVINEVTAQINAATRIDWSGAYATLPANTKQVLGETASCLAAIYGIAYDMSGYTGRGEAEDMINVLRDIALRNLKTLDEGKTKEFLGVA